MRVINMISMRSLHLHTLMNHQRLRRHFNLFWEKGAFHIDFFFFLSQSVFLKFLQTFVGNLKKKVKEEVLILANIYYYDIVKENSKLSL